MISHLMKYIQDLIEGIGKQGDILIGMSTSGNSKNVTKALEQAKKTRS